MLDEHSIARGWDDGGRPAPAKLQRLGLREIADEIAAAP
jgi:aldehyde:ferredoxin oxidoreductase